MAPTASYSSSAAASQSGVPRARAAAAAPSHNNAHLTRYVVVAPPTGRLGLTLLTGSKGGCVVGAVSDASPLRTPIRRMDVLVEVDGRDVSKMDAVQVAALMKEQGGNKGQKGKNKKERRLVFLSAGGENGMTNAPVGGGGGGGGATTSTARSTSREPAWVKARAEATAAAAASAAPSRSRSSAGGSGGAASPGILTRRRSAETGESPLRGMTEQMHKKARTSGGGSRSPNRSRGRQRPPAAASAAAGGSRHAPSAPGASAAAATIALAQEAVQAAASVDADAGHDGPCPPSAAAVREANRASAAVARAREAAGYILPSSRSTCEANREAEALARRGEKVPYPFLTTFGVPLGTDGSSANSRAKVLWEILAHNEKNGRPHEALANNNRLVRVVKVPGSYTAKKAARQKIKSIASGLNRSTCSGEDGNAVGGTVVGKLIDGRDVIAYSEAAAAAAASRADNNNNSEAAAASRTDDNNDDADDDNSTGERFIEHCRKTGFMGDLLSAIMASADYCADKEDAADLLMHYLARKHSKSYVKHAGTAQKQVDKGERSKKTRDPIVLPPGFQHFDDTPSFEWNINYMQLVEYHRENGDCLVPTGGSKLGRWVAGQRYYYKTKDKCMTPKRIELLEGLDFTWNLQPGREQYGTAGDPRFNRAMAARMAYPRLSVRQALILGGYDEADFDAVVDAKHTWRTKYVTLKDRMAKRWKDFDNAGERSKSKTEVMRLVGTLRAGPEGSGAAAVFGETAGLLPGFLEEAGV